MRGAELGRWLLAGILVASAAELFSQQPREPRAVLQSSHSQAKMNEVSESDDEAEHRTRLFWRIRGVVPGQNPALARLKALARRDEIAGASSHRMQRGQLNLNSYTWQCIGPTPLTVYENGNLSGRVPAIAVDPTNPDNVFIGAADGGVWKSTNGGASWTSLTDNQPSLAIGALAIDPLNPNVIFAGTGEPFPANQFTYSAGMLMSTDGGDTWTNIQQPFLVDGSAVAYSMSQIAIGPHNDQIVLAASPSGSLLSSGDGGVTWTVAAQGAFDAVVFDPKKTGVVYAGLIGSGGNPQVWSSADAGATWTQATVDTITGGRVVLAVGPDSALYVGVGSNQANVYKSTDSGQTFTQLNNINNYPENLCTAQCTYNLAIAVSPINPSEIWFGGLWLSRSLDGGQTWEENYGNYHTDQHAIVFSASGDRAYIGNDGGVYEANPPEAPPTTSLLDLNNGLATLQFYQGLSMAPGNLATGMGGMQDNGTALLMGSQWSFVLSGDSFDTAIDPADLNTVYSTTRLDNIYLSTTGGGLSTFSSFMNGLPPNSGYYTLLPSTIRIRIGSIRLREGSFIAPSTLAESGSRRHRCLPIHPSPSPLPFRLSMTM